MTFSQFKRQLDILQVRFDLQDDETAQAVSPKAPRSGRAA